jgi:hypothetical protein
MKKISSFFLFLLLLLFACEDRNSSSDLTDEYDSPPVDDSSSYGNDTTLQHLDSAILDSTHFSIIAHLTGYSVQYVGYIQTDSSIGFSSTTSESLFTHLRHPVGMIMNSDSATYAFKFHKNHPYKAILEDRYKAVRPVITADSVIFNSEIEGPGNLQRFAYSENTFIYVKYDSTGAWISTTSGWAYGLFGDFVPFVKEIMQSRGKFDQLTFTNFTILYDEK